MRERTKRALDWFTEHPLLYPVWLFALAGVILAVTGLTGVGGGSCE